MANYNSVNRDIWRTELEDFRKLTKLLAIYLATSPSANLLGAYYITKTQMVEETELTTEEVNAALPILQESGFAFYD